MLAQDASKDGRRIWLVLRSSRFGEGELLAIDTATCDRSWSRPVRHDQIILRLEGDRLLICEYESISCDTELRCVEAAGGKLVWEAAVDGINVPHSKYHQRARLEIRAGELLLIDQQSGGDFVESFHLETGASGMKWRSSP